MRQIFLSERFIRARIFHMLSETRTSLFQMWTVMVFSELPYQFCWEIPQSSNFPKICVFSLLRIKFSWLLQNIPKWHDINKVEAYSPDSPVNWPMYLSTFLLHCPQYVVSILKINLWSELNPDLAIVFIFQIGITMKLGKTMGHSLSFRETSTYML